MTFDCSTNCESVLVTKLASRSLYFILLRATLSRRNQDGRAFPLLALRTMVRHSADVRMLYFTKSSEIASGFRHSRTIDSERPCRANVSYSSPQPAVPGRERQKNKLIVEREFRYCEGNHVKCFRKLLAAFGRKKLQPQVWQDKFFL